MARKLRPDEELAFTADVPSIDPLLEEELLREFARPDDFLGGESRGQRADPSSPATDPRSKEDPEKS
jgi:hypothetical protein